MACFPVYLWALLVDTSKVQPMEKGVSDSGELSALYELETSLCVGDSGSHIGDVLGGAIFGVKS